MRLIHAVSLVRIQVPRPFCVKMLYFGIFARNGGLRYNDVMKHKHGGFTLVEVTLFLAVSGLLLLGVLSMTQASITSQRFNDVTQNFAEFLRKVYSDVANPQGIGEGRSEQAIYGRMITFGEKVDLSGNNVPSGEQKIFVYDVVGSANGIGTGDAISMLEGVGANTIIIKSINMS